MIYPCSVRTLTLNPKQSCPIPGGDSEVLRHILALGNISYEVNSYDVPWGEYVNGTWDGLLSLILNGTIDTIATA